MKVRQRDGNLKLFLVLSCLPSLKQQQQFGNFQNHEEMRKAKKDRGQFGRFYYRFPQGESGLDVYTRVSPVGLSAWLCDADSQASRPPSTKPSFGQTNR